MAVYVDAFLCPLPDLGEGRKAGRASKIDPGSLLSSKCGSATGNESIVETDVPLNAVRILMLTYMAFLTIF